MEQACFLTLHVDDDMNGKRILGKTIDPTVFQRFHSPHQASNHSRDTHQQQDQKAPKCTSFNIFPSHNGSSVTGPLIAHILLPPCA
jgi:hypothetical protein